MEQTTPKGATMLKVTGILMIIGGAISIIVSILAIIGIAAIAYLSDGSASLGLLYASGALLTVSSVAELIAVSSVPQIARSPKKQRPAWPGALLLLCSLLRVSSSMRSAAAASA